MLLQLNIAHTEEFLLKDENLCTEIKKIVYLFQIHLSMILIENKILDQMRFK